MTPPLVVAIDGPAGAGKGTLAKRLAAHYGLAHLDTGLLYRAVGRALLDAGLPLEDADAAHAAALSLDLGSLSSERLRDRGAGEAASIVSAYPAVRAALLDQQRCFAARAGGAVLDGRDIGTVVCPDASVKIYVVASAEERARRRHAELAQAGEAASFADILADILKRDERDMNRASAPLKPADDAVILDTTALDPDAAFAKACAIVDAVAADRAPGP
ncbi:MAG: (d)CMP kinase [Salinarimonadaceae bacterium]|nr:MAG: (d)CMP kinase [Salinarimonadaceae bacterium]